MEIEIRSPRTDVEWENYYNLRYRILRQPWGQPLGSERNEGDTTGIHLALFDYDRIKAIARLDISGVGEGQVRFVAVDKSVQGKGFGKLIMKEAESVSISRGDSRMILHAREVALDFYKSQGYEILEKSHVLFERIQHYLMQKKY
jgi:ribosomal protein S18 acetylase RimI-like enzyme